MVSKYKKQKTKKTVELPDILKKTTILLKPVVVFGEIQNFWQYLWLETKGLLNVRKNIVLLYFFVLSKVKTIVD